MKLAVVMSGMLRNFEHTFATTKKYIFDDQFFETVDVFFAGYPGKKGVVYCEEKFVNYYKPKSYLLQDWGPDIEKEIEEQTGVSSWVNNPTNSKAMNIMSFWRCRFLANELRKKYAAENNFEHDLVYNLRTDFFAFNNIDSLRATLAANDKNSVYVPEDWDFKSVNPICIGDPMAFGSASAMNKYFSLYQFAKTYKELGSPIHPETLLGNHFKYQNLNREYCDRNVAAEYPFSGGDTLKLWESTWNKEEAFKAMSLAEKEIKHRYNFD